MKRRNLVKSRQEGEESQREGKETRAHLEAFIPVLERLVSEDGNEKSRPFKNLLHRQ